METTEKKVLKIGNLELIHPNVKGYGTKLVITNKETNEVYTRGFLTCDNLKSLLGFLEIWCQFNLTELPTEGYQIDLVPITRKELRELQETY